MQRSLNDAFYVNVMKFIDKMSKKLRIYKYGEIKAAASIMTQRHTCSRRLDTRSQRHDTRSRRHDTRSQVSTACGM